MGNSTAYTKLNFIKQNRKQLNIENVKNYDNQTILGASRTCFHKKVKVKLIKTFGKKCLMN